MSNLFSRLVQSCGTPVLSPINNIIIQLHATNAEEITLGIRLYIQNMLEHRAPESTWYKAHDIDAFVVLCGGPFILATSSLLYVLDPVDDDECQGRLRKTIASP